MKSVKIGLWVGFERTCIAMDERPSSQMNAAFKVVKEADPGWRIEGRRER